MSGCTFAFLTSSRLCPLGQFGSRIATLHTPAPANLRFASHNRRSFSSSTTARSIITLVARTAPPACNYPGHRPTPKNTSAQRSCGLAASPSGMTSKVAHYSAASTAEAPDAKDGSKQRKKQAPPMEPRPSASIVLLSPTNQVLLLRRVKTSSAFASAHVFPGGNLAEFHDGPVPPPGDPQRHEDSRAYRLGAIRETFEESGILLARDVRESSSSSGGGGGGGLTNRKLLSLPAAERDRARKMIYKNEISFEEWLRSVGGEADIDNLHPFTRWITPPATPKRFTTQMYVYMLPLSQSATNNSSSDPVIAAEESEATLPTPDGKEVTTSVFEDASVWLDRASRDELILFPPQAFLLTLVGQFCKGARSQASASDYAAEREALVAFLARTPTASASNPRALEHPTSQIPWGSKVISPVTVLMRRDGRVVLALEKPGPELKGSQRGGEYERVVIVRFAKGSPREVEIRNRDEVFEEARREQAEEDQKKAQAKEKL
ncbi:hypothetical protein BX600DRAFT_505657 [Xylariales sp. PMI_506]|nr:hypothetical protein BX600DRAFT_505657 [Xylariales sp. PMI_506]